MIEKFRMAALTAILLLFALCAAAYGQGFGSIAGTVTDPSGAIVPGAQVTAINVDTGSRTTVNSNSTGVYQILQLIPGRYTIEAETKGFKTLKREGLKLEVDDRLTVDLALVLGLNTEVVSVVAESPLLRTEDAETGEVVNSTFVMNLPQLQRDPLQLLTVSGNVQGDGSRAAGGKGSGGSDTRINGGRTSGIDYLVDGVSAGTGVSHGVTSVTPGMDAVSEFKVITNGISAEYGRASGGLVEVVTKSGNNELHGQLFEYLQNDKLNANSWEQNALGGSMTPFRNNDFGFTLGGPVFLPKIYHGQNRTFFFANYEGTRFSQSGVLNTASVPTADMRNGNLSNVTYDGVHAMLFDPAAPDSTLITVTNPDGSTNIERTVLLGNGQIVPAARIESTGFALALQKLVPLPNLSGDAHSAFEYNYVGPQNTTSHSDVWGIRLDQNISDRQRLFGRFTHETYTYGGTAWRGVLSTAPGDTHPGAWSTNLNYVWTMSPTTIFNTRLSATFSPDTNGNVYASGGAAAIDALPLNATARQILGPGELPFVRFGINGMQMAYSANSSVANSTTYQLAPSLTKILTHHTLKMGFETRRFYDNFISSGAASWPYGGWWQITSSPVNQLVCDQCADQAQMNVNNYASYLLGIMDYDPTSGATNRAEEFNYYGAYVQDDFHVSSKLTLNLGLRWDMETPLTERHNRLYFWDPNASPSLAGISIAPGFNWNAALTSAGINPASVPTPSWVTNGLPNGLIMIPGTPEHPGRGMSAYHRWNFAPRLGAAYRLDSKTVIRGSFAMMYFSAMANPNSNAPDQAIALGMAANGGWHSSDPNGVPYAHYIDTMADPYHPGIAGGFVNSYTRSVAVANQQASNYSTVASGFNYYEQMPYELTQSFGIQRELPKGFLFEITYNGNEGRGLLSPYPVSAFPKSLFTPSNASVYGTPIQNPFVGTGTNGPVLLSMLMMQDPFYGPARVLGRNIGRSNYNALNLRVERRLWQGMTFLVNYTYGKMLDDVGGGEADADNSVDVGRGGKMVQSVDTIAKAYGYSPYDETHRLSATYSIELPFGRGKHFLGSPQGLGQRVLDGIAGGWQLAGTGIYRSGRPIVFGYDTSQVNNNYGIEMTFGSFAPGETNLLNPNFAGVSGVTLSNTDPRPTGKGAFNTANFVLPQTFTYGTLPPVYAAIRNPGNGQINLSLMKKFPLWGDASVRFLQLRVEATNALNIRGTANYNTDVNSSDFGFITADANNGTIAGNQERRMQVSARIVF